MTLRLTSKRKKILAAIQRHHGALSVADIHKYVPDIDLVTIYRSVELFTQEKLIKRVLLGTDEALYEYQAEPHHHAVCTDCERVIHFKAPDKKIIKLLGLEGFDVEELEVTVRGTCRKRT